MDTSKKIYMMKKGSRSTNMRLGRSKISNRRPINRFMKQQETENVSTSAKKLRMSEDDHKFDINLDYRNYLDIEL